MTRTPAEELDWLQQRLNYSFKDISLLERAVTHASLSGDTENIRSLERLEFLGDRVLGLLTAENLWRRYPHYAEGDMAPRLNALVRKDTCARAAAAIGIDRIIRLSPAEEENGGRQKPAILGDACEALLGALYIDGGLDAANKAYAMYWLEDFDNLAERYKDSKTTLQEWAQAVYKVTPKYRVVENSGPAHEPVFTVEVCIEGLAPAVASGSSKRAAQTLAAQQFLLREKIWTQDDIN
ncbi:ribonuclease III [Parvularcula sp. IMCC14364]|uniref:ribonuclease III n=1 Tax=Parvularcula sp. IMCC14364 TaxID=3067902 RepID=UPI002741E549|nr:ribonuclease III [Parvularcula sp. IMCC14364]